MTTKAKKPAAKSRAGENWSALRQRDLEALKNWDALPDAAHVRVAVVASLFGISKPTVWRRVSDGTLPPGRKTGPKTTAWLVGELRAQLRASQAAAQPRVAA